MRNVGKWQKNDVSKCTANLKGPLMTTKKTSPPEEGIMTTATVGHAETVLSTAVREKNARTEERHTKNVRLNAKEKLSNAKNARSTARTSRSTATGNHSEKTVNSTAMTKRINLFIMVSLLSVLAMAQGKKSFTLDDLLPGGSTYHQLQPQNLYTAWWGDRLVDTDLDGCHEINPKDGSKKVLFTLSQLNQWLGAGEDSSVVHSCYNVEFPDGGQP